MATIAVEFKEGLRPKSYTARGSNRLTKLLNMKATSEGLVRWDADLAALPSALKTNMIAEGLLDVNGYPANWPHPTLYFGREFALALGETSVYTINLSTWALTAITVYNNVTGASDTIPSGGMWQVADFGPVLFLFNGNCVVLRLAQWTDGVLGSYIWYVDKTAVPTTGANVRGRLMLGGFKAGGTTNGSLMAGLFAHAKSNLGMDFTYPVLSQYGKKSVWWSSISAEDMFLFFFPEMVYAMPDIIQSKPNSVSDGGFPNATTKWTLAGSGLSIASNHLLFAASSGTATQAAANQVVPLEVDKIYRVRYTVSSPTGGQVRVKLGSTTGTWRTSAGTYTEYLRCGSTTDVVVQGSAFSGIVDNLYVYEADTSLAEELFLRNEAGSKTTPWLGDVQRIEVLGQGAVIYTDDGVGALHPNLQGQFGWHEVSRSGVDSRGAVAGDMAGQVYLDHVGTFWAINEKYQATRLGFEEFGAILAANVPVATFDPNKRETYFCCDLGAGSPYGVGFSENGEAFRMTAAISSIGRYHDVSYGLVMEQSVHGVEVETDLVDFGGREAGTIVDVEVAHTGANLSLGISRRFDQASSMQLVATVPVTGRGKIHRATTGTEYKFKLTAPDYKAMTKIDYLKINYRADGKKSLRDLV